MSDAANDDDASLVAPRSCDATSAPAADDRRVEERRPLSCGFHIVPLDRRGKPIYSESFIAVGKNISSNGIAVSHLKEMQFPRALLTSMRSHSDQLQLEGEVAWTRPAGDGTYETGFKVVRKIV